ncbi:MAG: tRNA pseudouridine(13) synthase TruD [Candidatus Bathyarchaeia archaeon]|nr:MAG: tRNA pseudouridine(13) synthase TruD [Candidatus Bathyarchaeota archaeon]
MIVPKIEKAIGMEVYATCSKGIGGVLRQSIEDFIVEEVLIDGSKAEINPSGNGEAKVFNLSDAGKHYLLCILVKRNWDTFLAVRAVAEQLGISPNQIQIAGIKDTRAVTAQHITVEGLTSESLSKVKVRDVEIRPVGYFRGKISPYFLLGNNFRITVRAISHSRNSIKKQMEETIREIEALGGVPNFFGHQRFGTTRPITHFVGKALIQGNFKRAAMIFLAKPSQNEHPESRRARENLWATQDFEKALKIFPKNLRYEHLMLKHLAKKPDDFIGAFRRLPKKLLKLFPQAYQAYLFNKFLSERIKRGLLLNEASVGDYVVNVERNGLPMLNIPRVVDAKIINEVNEALKAGRMRLALPLVGFRRHLSKGFQGEIEEQILEEEEISPENFKVKMMREISSKGEFRTATTPLKNFTLYEIARDNANPSKNMIKLHFTLLRGSYATVLLREIMKTRNPVKAGF